MSRTERPHRYGFEAPIEIYWGSATLLARVCNISVEGLFLEISTPLWIGATFSATMMLQAPLPVNCTVCRIVPSQGMGVQVTFASPETRKRYTDLLEELSRMKRDSKLEVSGPEEPLQ